MLAAITSIRVQRRRKGVPPLGAGGFTSWQGRNYDAAHSLVEATGNESGWISATWGRSIGFDVVPALKPRLDRIEGVDEEINRESSNGTGLTSRTEDIS